jgi:hypothetical protein
MAGQDHVILVLAVDWIQVSHGFIWEACFSHFRVDYKGSRLHFGFIQCRTGR